MFAAAGGASLASRQARQKQKHRDQVKQPKIQTSETSLPKTKGFHSLPPSYYDHHQHQGNNGPGTHLSYAHQQKCPKYNSSLKIGSGNELNPNYERRYSTISTMPKQSHYKMRSSRSVFDIQKNLSQDSTNTKDCLMNFKEHLLTLDEHSSSIKEYDNDSYVLVRKSDSLIDDFNEPIPVPMDRNNGTGARYSSCHYENYDQPFSECSQGRSAWIEQEKQRTGIDPTSIRQSDAQKLWRKRYRIRDLSTARIIESENFHESAAANTLLYVGLGSTAIGMIVAFVGNAEKGFKTMQLKMIGPCLMIFGFICVFLRVLSCFCTLDCILCRKSKKKYKDRNNYMQMEEVFANSKPQKHNRTEKKSKCNNMVDSDRRIAITKNSCNRDINNSSSDDFFHSDYSMVHSHTNYDMNNDFNYYETNSDYNSHTGILLNPLDLPLQ